jgi:predicted nucleic acid-binding protein
MERVVFDLDLCIDWINQHGQGLNPRTRFRLVNDCLIALSSRQVGATVITRNERDFRPIQQVAPFSLIIVP